MYNIVDVHKCTQHNDKHNKHNTLLMFKLSRNNINHMMVSIYHQNKYINTVYNNINYRYVHHHWRHIHIWNKIIKKESIAGMIGSMCGGMFIISGMNREALFDNSINPLYLSSLIVTCMGIGAFAGLLCIENIYFRIFVISIAGITTTIICIRKHVNNNDNNNNGINNDMDVYDE